MRIKFHNYTDISEVLKFNTGIKPKYGKGTMEGVVWCSCGCCTGDIVLWENNTIIGWIDTECISCGNKIDYSEADKHIHKVSI